MGTEKPREVSTSELQQQMLKHALAFATGIQYSKNPDLLQHHQAVRFDQIPPDSFDENDPAKNVVGLVVTYQENGQCPQRGFYYNPTNAKVRALL